MSFKSAVVTAAIFITVLGISHYTAYYAGGVEAIRDRDEQEQKHEKTVQDAQQQIAADVLKGLSDWSQNTKTVEIRSEKTNTVFRNVCITDEYKRLFNGRVTDAENSLSGRTDSKVSDGKPTKTTGSNGE